MRNFSNSLSLLQDNFKFEHYFDERCVSHEKINLVLLYNIYDVLFDVFQLNFSFIY